MAKCTSTRARAHGKPQRIYRHLAMFDAPSPKLTGNQGGGEGAFPVVSMSQYGVIYNPITYSDTEQISEPYIFQRACPSHLS